MSQENYGCTQGSPTPQKKSELFIERLGLNNQKSVYVKVPYEKHIQVSVSELQIYLKDFIDDDLQPMYFDFEKVLECLCSVQFLDIKSQLKKNFGYFARASKGEPLLYSKNQARPSKEELDLDEQKFVEDFVYLLKVSHYHQLQQVEWEAALKNSFLFNLPVQINWDHMDSYLLSRYWKSVEQDVDQQEPFQHRDRVLVFYRGVGMEKRCAYFFWEKIDLLVDYIIADPFMEFWEYITKLFSYTFKKFIYNYDYDNDKKKSAQILEYNTSKHRQNCAYLKTGQIKNNLHSQLIERRTLEQVLHNWKQIIYMSWQQIEIQEPTFKNVIILYRNKVDVNSSNKSQGNQAQQSLKRNIQIKSFDDIAMADLEMVFPQKKIVYKPIIVITIVITCILALITLIYILIQETTTLNMLVSTFSVFGFKLYQSYTQAEKEKSDLQSQMNELTYQRVKNAQEGVLFSLIEDMNEEFFKEVLLVYTILLQKGGFPEGPPSRASSIINEGGSNIFASYLARTNNSNNSINSQSSYTYKHPDGSTMPYNNSYAINSVNKSLEKNNGVERRNSCQIPNGNSRRSVFSGTPFEVLNEKNSSYHFESQDTSIEGFTLQELELSVEKIMLENFEQKIDFDIKFALNHMQKVEILDSRTNDMGETIYFAKPLREAIEKLTMLYQLSISQTEEISIRERLEQNIVAAPKKTRTVKKAVKRVVKVGGTVKRRYDFITDVKNRLYSLNQPYG